MEYSYYPGCTLTTKAKDLDLYARKCAAALGVELREIDEWQCCGGMYTSAQDEIVTKLSSIRALHAAKEKGRDLVTVCSTCHNVIKRVNHDMAHNETVRQRANEYLRLDEPYRGETRVLHYLELLRDAVGFEAVAKAVVHPVRKKIAAYYGCALLRPSDVMRMDDPENPSILEDFISAVGGTPVVSPYRNECCGGYLTVKGEPSVRWHVADLTDSCVKKGAELIITACPLCAYNLKKHGGALPVAYFTEILAEALGVK